jgi:hypothetical protein
MSFTRRKVTGPRGDRRITRPVVRQDLGGKMINLRARLKAIRRHRMLLALPVAEPHVRPSTRSTHWLTHTASAQIRKDNHHE